MVQNFILCIFKIFPRRCLAVAIPFFGFRTETKMGTFRQLTLLGSITLRKPILKKKQIN